MQSARFTRRRFKVTVETIDASGKFLGGLILPGHGIMLRALESGTAEPKCIMTGGAGWKMAPSMSVQFELVDNLIFDGLLEMAAQRFNA